MNAEASRPRTVTAYQLGLALHDYFTCPLRHDEGSKRYVDARTCERLGRLVADAGKVLEWATSQPLVPELRDETQDDSVDAWGQALPPGHVQTSLLQMLEVR